MLNDRQIYINSISAAKNSQAARFMKRWQGARDVDFRMLYLESISSKGMLASMASVRWKLSYCDLVDESQEP